MTEFPDGKEITRQIVRMFRVSQVLHEHGDWMNRITVIGLVPGERSNTSQALDALASRGFVTERRIGRLRQFLSVRRFGMPDNVGSAVNMSLAMRDAGIALLQLGGWATPDQVVAHIAHGSNPIAEAALHHLHFHGYANCRMKLGEKFFTQYRFAARYMGDLHEAEKIDMSHLRQLHAFPMDDGFIELVYPNGNAIIRNMIGANE